MTITEKIDAITHLPAEYLRPDPPCPKSVKVELTARCNYRCGFCALRMRDCQPGADEDMPLEDFKRISREMREAGVVELGLFYLGESFMNTELLIAACEYAKQELEYPYVFLTTNGSRATRRSLRRLMQAGLDSLKFSVNAHSPEQFVEIMGVKERLYEKALDAIQDAAEIKEELGASTNIYASSIMYDGEQQEKMEELVETRVRPYVQEHYWLPLYSMGAVATQREEELGYKPTAGNQGRVGGLVKPLPCWSAFSEGHVRSDLEVSVCCFDADGRFRVGNLKDHSWMEIWHNEQFQELRRAHLAKNLKGTVCEDCIAYR